jgi:hypothetical protein
METTVWQRVRDSNPCTGLERALIYLRKMLITSDLSIAIFPVALLLLTPRAFQNVFDGSNQDRSRQKRFGTQWISTVSATPGCHQSSLARMGCIGCKELPWLSARCVNWRRVRRSSFNYSNRSVFDVGQNLQDFWC